ncbi:MAG: hypothetical protein ACK5PU_04055 [bacterium]|jgi:hypothetical protein
MAGAFLYSNLARGAVLTSAQANVASMPVANLQDAQPRRRVRFNATSATLDVDLLAPAAVDCVALISTTLSASATIRVRLANVADFSAVLTDTGTNSAEAQDQAQGNVIVVLPAPITARYLRIDLADGAASFMDAGVLAVGALWRVLRGTAYGIREGRVMLDKRDRNPFTGAEFPVPAIANPRFAAFTLPSLSVAEARTQHRALLAALGAAGDALWIAELNDTMAERNRRAIWGAVNAPGEDAAVARDNLPLSSRAFRIQERL